MRTPLKISLIAALGISVCIAIGVAAENSVGKAAEPLAIEIQLAKPFYVPAARPGKSVRVVIRVPVEPNASADAITAVKLEPRMDGDNVRVSVFALVGPTSNIKTCSEWDALKSTLVGTYLAGLDDEIVLTKLRDFGVGTGMEPLTFRVVPKRTLSPLPQAQPEGCECGSCGGLICCPNPGYCLGCGSCGDVCCSNV